MTPARTGFPAVIDDPDDLTALAAAFGRGSGPVAVDTERAGSFRYSQRAYLIQIGRSDTGWFCIDPIALPDLTPLRRALHGTEMILHSAAQDLPGLREAGLAPSHVFDTELAAKLLHKPGVSLAALCAAELDVHLEKAFSAVDWSTRPLPDQWVAYALDDIVHLPVLRDGLAEQLAVAGKDGWAAEEFEHVRTALPKLKLAEPWRRTSGIHRLRNRSQLHLARALWHTRDRIAAERDLHPGRVIRDGMLVALAQRGPTTADAYVATVRENRSEIRRTLVSDPTVMRAMVAAIVTASAEPAVRFPTPAGPQSGPPPLRSWPERNPAAHDRWLAVKDVPAIVADDVDVPVEVLINAETLRTLAWDPPVPTDEAAISRMLRAAGLRMWQVGLLAPALAEVLDGTRHTA